eukprot:m.91359 g.91359  ORF g.91359 m.91359 type:complete len:569 (-) comp15299_c0_seq1:307-2013(-)
MTLPSAPPDLERLLTLHGRLTALLASKLQFVQHSIESLRLSEVLATRIRGSANDVDVQLLFQEARQRDLRMEAMLQELVVVSSGEDADLVQSAMTLQQQESPVPEADADTTLSAESTVATPPATAATAAAAAAAAGSLASRALDLLNARIQAIQRIEAELEEMEADWTTRGYAALQCMHCAVEGVVRRPAEESRSTAATAPSTGSGTAPVSLRQHLIRRPDRSRYDSFRPSSYMGQEDYEHPPQSRFSAELLECLNEIDGPLDAAARRRAMSPLARDEAGAGSWASASSSATSPSSSFPQSPTSALPFPLFPIGSAAAAAGNSDAPAAPAAANPKLGFGAAIFAAAAAALRPGAGAAVAAAVAAAAAATSPSSSAASTAAAAASLSARAGSMSPPPMQPPLTSATSTGLPPVVASSSSSLDVSGSPPKIAAAAAGGGGGAHWPPSRELSVCTRIQFVEVFEADGVTYYRFLAEFENGKMVMAKRRYSDFVDLHQYLRERAKLSRADNMLACLPTLPKKKLTMVNKKAVTDERVTKLTQYLQDLVGMQPAFPVVAQFLDVFFSDARQHR